MMRSKFIYLLFSAVVFLTLSGCGAQKETTASLDNPTPQQMDSVITAQNTFALTVFDGLTQEENHENKLISPLSLYMALSMAYNGADGETQKAMRTTLQLNGIETALLNKTNLALLKNLTQTDSLVAITIANALWYRQTLNLTQAFSNLNQNGYQADIQAADFDDPKTVAAINNWVSTKTKGKIKTIIQDIKPGDLMFLLNAVYFKGQWTNMFNPRYTRENTFYAEKGEQKVPFMYEEAHYNYMANERLQMVELPYGNQQFSMYVLLPSKSHSVDTLIAKLSPKILTNLKTELQSTKLKLYLPKWEAAYTAGNLKQVLSNMGMGVAFSNAANFSKIFEEASAKISQIKHKTYIKVNESGTEAAAVTSIGMTTTSVQLNPPPVMKVNRPFVYLIMDNKQGSILFLGVIRNPKH